MVATLSEDLNEYVCDLQAEMDEVLRRERCGGDTDFAGRSGVGTD